MSASQALPAAQAEAIRSKLNGRSLVMVGLMGAGKTTIGRRLAARLEMPFCDADTEIEAAAGMTISEIFDSHGEEHFRAGEHRVIARLLQAGPMVIATGGGAFMNAETRARIAENGLSIWLRADLALLMKRVRRRSHRPLLKSPDPEGVMRRLIDERYPVYAHADIIIDSRDTPHSQIVSDVITALENGSA